MSYALHRRTAFRQSGPVSGWTFDLNSSTFLVAANLMSNNASSATGGTAIAPRHLFLPEDSSFLLAHSTGAYTYHYNFPIGHFGDLSFLQDARWDSRQDTHSSGYAAAFSPDGRHYVRQGANATSNYKLYSCPVDSPFDISSIRADTQMSVLDELSNAVQALAFSADGLSLFVFFAGTVRSYYLQVPFDVSSAYFSFTEVAFRRFVSSISAGGVSGAPNSFVDFQFSPDGLSLVALWNDNNQNRTAVLFLFRLSVPFNITTLALDHYWGLGDNNFNCFVIDPAGANLYLARSISVRQYALSA